MDLVIRLIISLDLDDPTRDRCEEALLAISAGTVTPKHWRGLPANIIGALPRQALRTCPDDLLPNNETIEERVRQDSALFPIVEVNESPTNTEGKYQVLAPSTDNCTCTAQLEKHTCLYKHYTSQDGLAVNIDRRFHGRDDKKRTNIDHVKRFQELKRRLNSGFGNDSSLLSIGGDDGSWNIDRELVVVQGE
ncbi:hypothetical protein P153DRAFT_356939 [Dothidotthia symphoricarpi CBS 119687]|uniref:Uncharacterized protein n=1 Tax=Dothidotthia symphoricarpi CBS 119687 TaxID=1392245 RepID=A0A6A6AEH7_9PLEO|nr:uncharacterized protein P153DRAFT_356939 [Dothidotthia symphoricarpi CBS 119687]KAF2129354.1 hypothetical protein P153DRAFT_356939 [Dothidotthia symphoricarpi CBS 119687]